LVKKVYTPVAVQ